MPPQGAADARYPKEPRPRRRASARGVMDGARYIESLRDGREVWLHGEKVADVTKHPAFANVVRTIADLYDLQHQVADAGRHDLRRRRWRAQFGFLYAADIAGGVTADGAEIPNSGPSEASACSAGCRISARR